MQKGIPQQSQRNPWLSGSLTYMLRLSLMAIGGYNPDSFGLEEIKSANLIENSSQRTRRQNRAAEFASFSFQNTEDFCSNFGSSTHGAFVNQNQGEPQKDKSGIINGNVCRITVSRVQFSRSDEVDLLLLETVKTFADFICSTPSIVSRHALFCLNVSFYYC